MGVKDPQINIHVEFAGGLELLLDGRKEASVALPVADPAAPPRMQQLLLHVADHLVCHSRDLFLKPDTMQLYRFYQIFSNIFLGVRAFSCSSTRLTGSWRASANICCKRATASS